MLVGVERIGLDANREGVVAAGGDSAGCLASEDEFTGQFLMRLLIAVGSVVEAGDIESCREAVVENAP